MWRSASLFSVLSGLACAACGSDDDPFVASVQSELSSAGFACGAELCHPNAEYCVLTRREARRYGDETVSFACARLPQICLARPSCNCMDTTLCTERRGNIVVERAD